MRSRTSWETKCMQGKRHSFFLLQSKTFSIGMEIIWIKCWQLSFVVIHDLASSIFGLPKNHPPKKCYLLGTRVRSRLAVVCRLCSFVAVSQFLPLTSTSFLLSFFFQERGTILPWIIHSWAENFIKIIKTCLSSLMHYLDYNLVYHEIFYQRM